MVVHTGGMLGCASYRLGSILYQLQAHSQTFRKGMINVCRQSQEQHNVFSNLGMHLKWFDQKHVV